MGLVRWFSECGAATRWLKCNYVREKKGHSFMDRPIEILLQTTIPTTEDDWSIARFSMLGNYLASLRNENGKPLCNVTSRDRASDPTGNDPVLSTLGESNFDQLWLFAVDVGDGLTAKDAEGIQAFYARGGGIMATRDHQDLGCSINNLDCVGAFHYFHTQNPDPDTSRHCCDDTQTTTILWPNYHSGANGDFQRIMPLEPIHDLLRNPSSPTGIIEFFPSHPHEGAVGASDRHARVIARGKSLSTGRIFNLAVAIDPRQNGSTSGRVLAESTFHHFCDYNWDASAGAPSFVTEPPGNGMNREPRALEDIHAYVRNIVLWLSAK
jgi:hypothetical protein